MPTNLDRQRFNNEDLVLKVSSAVNRAVWDEDRYALFLDELCGDREYQKNAIRTALRYLLSGEYTNLRQLAKESFESNFMLESRYGSWKSMERHLQLPDQLSASIDLATGTGKSFVLYGIATILLSEGVVDRILVLCPSTTIEYGLLEKFRELAANASLRDLLPSNAAISVPSISNASQSIVEGSICVENYHAILEHVGSSIRDSLIGKGDRVAVLNDEAHHVANESKAQEKKWKSFLANPEYGFRFVVGVSGTCYVNDDYFADVIYRFSLREAIEQRFVKKIDYIAEMPKATDPDEKWQLIYNRHDSVKRQLQKRFIRPLTIVVTQTVNVCKNVAEDLKHHLISQGHATIDNINEKVLIIYNNAPDLTKLPQVDNATSEVEWIVSVSMLNEGWDVKRVFQIVPHEERAFNSKLLIAQVLGRGLRIPKQWTGDQPVVTVFNHDAWASSIRHLVNEVLEIERRVSSVVGKESNFNFDLHNIDYQLSSTAVETPMEGSYNLFEKGYVNLSSELAVEDVNIEFERANTGETYKWQTQIKRKTYTSYDVAFAMYQRLEEAQDPDDPDPQMRTVYTDEFSIERLEAIINESLQKINKTEITEGMKQKFLSAMGTLRRKVSKSVRYISKVDRYSTISTATRPPDSASISELRHRKTLFYTPKSRDSIDDEQAETFDEIIEPGSGFKAILVTNYHDFKTPQNLVIADSENEQKFIRGLTDPKNVSHVQAWLKSTSTRFYEIDFSWRKSEHSINGKFNPDFFIKVNNDLTLVVEIKEDQEIREPSEENIKKNEYALRHFDNVNRNLSKEGIKTKYQFHFLSPKNFNAFFQHIREENISDYKSDLDVALVENG